MLVDVRSPALRVRAVRRRACASARALAPRRRSLRAPRAGACPHRGRRRRVVHLVPLAAQPVLQPARAGRRASARERSSGLGTGSACTSTRAPTRIWTTPTTSSSTIDYERRLLEDWLERPVSAVSLHNPGRAAGRRYARRAARGSAERLRIGARVALRVRVRLERVLALSSTARRARRPGRSERLHVLTHPEWWTPEAMSPRERVVRSVEGRGSRVLSDYDALLARHDRINVR